MDTDAVLRLLQDVCAEVITPRFCGLGEHEVSEKSPGDLVTVADHEAEALITAELRGAYPEAVVLGEEACAGSPELMGRFLAAPHAFTVDPIDGTANFVHGSPDHAVMVAEIRGGCVVRGWIWQPEHGQAYVAEKGAGAYRNRTRLTLSPPSDPPRVITSYTAWSARLAGDLPPLGLTWFSCGIDYPRLVEGHADAIVYRDPMPWDHAPGSLVLSEAGGVTTEFGGRAFDVQHPAPGMVAAADDTVSSAVLSSIPELEAADSSLVAVT